MKHSRFRFRFSLASLVALVFVAAVACHYFQVGQIVGVPLALSFFLASMILPYFIFTRHGEDRAFWIGFALTVFISGWLRGVVRTMAFEAGWYATRPGYNDRAIWIAFDIGGMLSMAISGGMLSRWIYRLGVRHFKLQSPPSSIRS
jgi:hypothetical protein